MECDAEYADEFQEWFDSLDDAEKEDVMAYVYLLEKMGVTLKHPYCSGINGSEYSHMRELRVQHNGKPYRVLYAFDPRRKTILLIGGDKTGDKRWYKVNVPITDKICSTHLESLKTKGGSNG